LAAISAGSVPGGEYRLSLPAKRAESVGHPETMGRLLRLAHRRPLERRRALGLFPGGPPNHRASGRIRVQELLLEGPVGAAPLRARGQRRAGTRHLDCITIGT